MATKYDRIPTSINTPEREAQMQAEALAEAQERQERLHQAAEVMGSLATEQANTAETEQVIEEGVVIEGHFGTSEDSVQAELKRLEEEAKARIEELNQQQEQLAA